MLLVCLCAHVFNSDMRVSGSFQGSSCHSANIVCAENEWTLGSNIFQWVRCIRGLRCCSRDDEWTAINILTWFTLIYCHAPFPWYSHLSFVFQTFFCVFVSLNFNRCPFAQRKWLFLQWEKKERQTIPVPHSPPLSAPLMNTSTSHRPFTSFILLCSSFSPFLVPSIFTTMNRACCCACFSP